MNNLLKPLSIIKRSQKLSLKSNFTFEFKTEKLLSKNTKTNNRENETRKFLQELKSELEYKNRRKYKIDVCLFIDIFSCSRNAPDIHSISKFYIDLLYKGNGSNILTNKYENNCFILNDDKQIKHLEVNYTQSMDGKSKIIFRFTSYKLFLEKIRFAKWYLANHHHHEEYFTMSSDKDNSRPSSLPNEFINSSQDESIFMRKFDKWQLQEWYYNDWRLKNREILDLFEPFHNPSIDNLNIPKTEFCSRKLGFESNKTCTCRLDFEFIKSRFQLDLGSLPNIGGRKQWEKDLYNKIDDFMQKHKDLDPPLVPLCMTFYLKLNRTSNKDLDNIPHEVIPKIAKKLLPPTSHKASFLGKISNDLKQGSITFPITGFISYRLILFSSKGQHCAEDDNGFLLVNIHNALNYVSFEHYIIKVLSKLKY